MDGGAAVWRWRGILCNCVEIEGNILHLCGDGGEYYAPVWRWRGILFTCVEMEENIQLMSDEQDLSV